MVVGVSERTDRYRELLATDFDGRLGASADDVIHDGLDDARHQERVPGIAELMGDGSASAQERFMACVALTTWGEEAGYQGVIAAAQEPKEAPWYEVSIDRLYSVDNTFAHLFTAADDSAEISSEKGSSAQRGAVLRGLVRVADTEYFDGKLAYAPSVGGDGLPLSEIETVVRRGVDRLARGENPRFDLAAQLIDLASVVAPEHEDVAVELARNVLAVASHERALSHAVAVVQRGSGDVSREFGEYLATIGDEKVRHEVREAMRS